MKLKTHLRKAPLEQLRQIAHFWELCPSDPATLEDSQALADHLYPRMQTAPHFKTAFDKLSSRQREILYFLAIHGGELPSDEFRKRCNIGSASELDALFAEVAGQGFLWREKVKDSLASFDLIGVAEPFVRLIELPPYWQGFLGYYLQSLGTDELRHLVRSALDARATTRKKQILVHFLRRKLLDPESLQACLDRRDQLQLEMFQQILQRNGVCRGRNCSTRACTRSLTTRAPSACAIWSRIRGSCSSSSPPPTSTTTC